MTYQVGDIIKYTTWTKAVFQIDKVDRVDKDYVYFGTLIINDHPSTKDVFRIAPIDIKYWTLVSKGNPYKNGKLDSGGNL